MNDSVREEIEYGVRFIDISNKDAELLNSMLGSFNSSLRKRKKDSKLVFTADIVLENVSLICDLIPQISASKIDVFISLLPESDSDIYDVPNFVVQVLCSKNVALTVSFTYIED